MRLMHISVQLTWILPTSTSRLACSFCKTTKTRPLPMALPQSLVTSILKLTSPLLSTVQQHRNGELPNPSSRLKDQLHQRWAEQVGTVPWLRFAIRACRLSS